MTLALGWGSREATSFCVFSNPWTSSTSLVADCVVKS
jgi:hypothetical protein